MTNPTSNSIIHTQSVPIQQNSLILEMPFDVVVEIFKRMGVQELGHCQFACHLWNQILRNEIVCQQLLKNHFPFYRLPKEIQNFKEVYQDQRRLHLNLINGIYAESTINLDLGGSKISSLFISGKTLYSGEPSGKFKIWNLDTKTCVETLDVHYPIDSFVISGRKLVCPSSWNGQIKIWDLETKTCIGTLSGHEEEVSRLALSDDGTLISSAWDKKIKIWNLETNSCEATLEGHDEVCSLAVSSDGTLYYSDSRSDNCYRRIINIWDLKTKTHIGTIEDRLCGIYFLVISDDNLYSFSHYGCNSAIKIWDLNTRERIQTFGREEVEYITCSSFHAVSDGKLYSRVYPDSNVETIKVWDFKAEYNTVFDALANQLESDDFEIFDQAMERFSRMPKRARNEIYGELYKILKRLNLIPNPNDYWGCGEHAFHGIIHGTRQGSTSSQKAEAIRNYLQEQLKKDSHPRELQN